LSRKQLRVLRKGKDPEIPPFRRGGEGGKAPGFLIAPTKGAKTPVYSQELP